MTAADFDRLRAFLKQRSGLDLAPEKIYLAESRLQPVCAAWRVATPADVIAALDSDEALADAVVDAMATHETMFFRDRGLFERIERHVIPSLLAARAGEKRLRIWSAATSTGQEAYSLAMLLAGLGRHLADWRVTILATDLSAACLARAQTGLYSQFEVQRGLPIFALLRHFTQSEDGWRISRSLQEAVRFRQVNLLDGFAQLGTFDLVLCRNVLIYLDRATRIDLLGRLGDAIEPDGFLCLGTAETAVGFAPALAGEADQTGVFVRADPRGLAA